MRIPLKGATRSSARRSISGGRPSRRCLASSSTRSSRCFGSSIVAAHSMLTARPLPPQAPSNRPLNSACSLIRSVRSRLGNTSSWYGMSRKPEQTPSCRTNQPHPLRYHCDPAV
uniref:Uncharacterized protein n=1 Tax=Burkholderia sp. M701 TaxID=326454 RepID=V5YND7_9BURK|nr:hypothetical protein [Burkholderia sp. M701]